MVDGPRAGGAWTGLAEREPASADGCDAAGGRHHSEHRAVAGVGRAVRGSWVIRMAKPPRKPPTASQPAQGGKRTPKVAAKHQQHRVPDADPAQ